MVATLNSTESKPIAVSKELGIFDFLKALQVAQPYALEGNDEAIKKFILILQKLMPKDLATGRYKNLGKLLLRLSSYMPLLSSRYTANKVLERKMRHTIQDIVETVDYVLKKLVDSSVDIEAIKETMTIFDQRLSKIDKIKSKFKVLDIGQALRDKLSGSRVIVGDHSTANYGKISILLQSISVSVTRASSLSTFQQKIANKNHFSLAILDYLISTPETSGLGVLKKLQSEGFDLPMIFFLDINDRGGMEICREEGVPFITSKSSSNELLYAIKKLEI